MPPQVITGGRGVPLEAIIPYTGNSDTPCITHPKVEQTRSQMITHTRAVITGEDETVLISAQKRRTMVKAKQKELRTSKAKLKKSQRTVLKILRQATPFAPIPSLTDPVVLPVGAKAYHHGHNLHITGGGFSALNVAPRLQEIENQPFRTPAKAHTPKAPPPKSNAFEKASSRPTGPTGPAFKQAAKPNAHP